MVSATDIMDFNNWWPSLYKKTCHSDESVRLPRQEKVKFLPSQFMEFTYTNETPGKVIMSPFIVS